VPSIEISGMEPVNPNPPYRPGHGDAEEVRGGIDATDTGWEARKRRLKRDRGIKITYCSYVQEYSLIKEAMTSTRDTKKSAVNTG